MSACPYDFPHLVDNTMRSDFISCPRKFYWSYIRKLAPTAPSIHLHAGGAFASALEACKRAFYQHGKSEQESLRAGLERLIQEYGPIQLPPSRVGDKSCENLMKAFASYFERYPLGKDVLRPFIAPNGEACLEFRFSIPTEIPHPQTGNPILFGGRTDEISQMQVGEEVRLMVGDEKTTTSLGDQWADQWRLDSQFTGYVKAAQMHGFPVAGVVVRGIGLLKTKISHAEVILYRAQWVIDRWWKQLHRDIQRMVNCWQEDEWDYAISKSSCSAYGGCAFRLLTDTPDPESYVAGNYRERIWNPLAKDSGEDLLHHPELSKQLVAPDLVIPGLDKP